MLQSVRGLWQLNVDNGQAAGCWAGQPRDGQTQGRSIPGMASLRNSQPKGWPVLGMVSPMNGQPKSYGQPKRDSRP